MAERKQQRCYAGPPCCLSYFSLQLMDCALSQLAGGNSPAEWKLLHERVSCRLGLRALKDEHDHSLMQPQRRLLCGRRILIRPPQLGEGGTGGGY